MEGKLLLSRNLKKYFSEKNYNCLKPYKVVNDNDTIFLTAGIQPILSDYRNNRIEDNKKIYLSQPVIRTQFSDSIAEGSSIAFINSTTAGFNITEKEHNTLVKDWIDLFRQLGLHSSDFSNQSKDYQRIWGDLLVTGKKTFYYYNNLELGDATFFTEITKDGKNIGIDSMSDVGFGLERIRWCISEKSYFDLYNDSLSISLNAKAYLSVLALLAVNDVKPSNKNYGYRARLFSKKLVNILEGKDFSESEVKYLMDCIRYWKDWQEVNNEIDLETIKTEYVRNCNRYIIDKLIEEGYKNLSGININISREEMKTRLISSNVETEKVKKLMR